MLFVYYYLCYSLGLPFLSGVALAIRWGCPFCRAWRSLLLSGVAGAGRRRPTQALCGSNAKAFVAARSRRMRAESSPALKTAPRTLVAGCISPARVQTSLEGLGDYRYD